MADWTVEQVVALAPDEASVKAGRGLANAPKWVSFGANEQAVWGECKGSGSSPYQCQIELSEPAFKCSCPSRKFPCKHGLGLFLMYVAQASAFTQNAPPAWVEEWLSKREQKAERQAKKAEAIEKDPEAQKKAEVAQQKRAAERESRVKMGLEGLDLWLRDLVREGLAALPSKSYSFWDEQAARLVDAQAPGIARWLREMAGIPMSGAGWQERLLERIGLLYLAIEGYKRIETLPESTQADIRSVIGWTMKQEELSMQPGIADQWLVLGQRVSQEEMVTVQRNWLLGQQTGRTALILNFAAFNQKLDVSLVPGSSFEAELVYYPGSYPLRAVIKERRAPSPFVHPAGYASIEQMLSANADALASNPWIEQFPALFNQVIPTAEGDHWLLQDSAGNTLPIHTGYERGWHLLSISGGHPITVFAEWDGYSLLPLNAWAMK